MKPLHLYVQAKSWQRRVILIAMYHNYQCIKDKSHKLSQTSSYFHVSIGLVSENLKLFKKWDEVKNCNTRKDALGKIK